MKQNKLLAIVLFISFILACTSCNISDIVDTFWAEEPSVSQAPPSVWNPLETEEPSSTKAPSSTNSPAVSEPPASSDTPAVGSISPINVLMVNDNHGVMDEEQGGMDKIASGISYYASLGNVVKIANGDMFQGTYVSSSLRGLPMLEILNELDFDAFVIGNHEFDWGLDEIKKYKDGDISNGEAEFPFLGANIYSKSTGKMVDWLEPYAVVAFGEIKIGIIGIIGHVEGSILPSHLAAYDLLDAEDIVKDLAHELRTDKDCDVVIVSMHEDDGGLNDTLASYEGSYRIDAIFAGHSHAPIDEEITRADGKEICVLQNGGNGESFASLTLAFDEKGDLKDTDGKLNYTSDFSSSEILNAVFEKYEEYMTIGDRVLLNVDYDISRRDVGIEVAHSMYVKYGTDFAVINTGGVRASIDAGEVTYAEIFQILPFENEVYIVTLSGAQLKAYLAGAKIYYWGIDINSLVDSLEYRLAIVDFVYLGYTFDDYRNDSCIDTNDLIRDVFIEYIRSVA